MKFRPATPAERAHLDSVNRIRESAFYSPSRFFCLNQDGHLVASMPGSDPSKVIGSLLEGFELNDEFGAPILIDLAL